MLVESVVLIRKGLENPGYGVNVKLQEVPRFAEDPQPRDVAAFLDPCTSEAVYRGNLGTDRPLCIVSQPRSFEIEGEDHAVKVDTDVQGMEIAIAYVTENSAIKNPEGLRATYYTMRAMQRAARALFLNDNAGDREWNNVQLRDILSIQVVPQETPFEGIDDLLIAGVMYLRLGVRDTEPNE